MTITKLVHGGQGLARLDDGRTVFVWNALPGEVVNIRIIKSKRNFAEGIAEEIVHTSVDRVKPVESNYLSTSPWQIMTFEAENNYKRDIVDELFGHEGVILPDFGPVVHDDRQWHYRNKMEYSFWGDDTGLHLALHQRGSHGKQIVTGSELATSAVDAGARAIVSQLSDLHSRAGDLKTIIVRSNQKGDAVAALYTKLDKFAKLVLPPELKGLRVYHSNPKSPASVPTSLLYEIGECELTDDILGKKFEYDVSSFFQVNLPIYEKALIQMQQHSIADPVDMYAGVGSIGLSLAKRWSRLVEIDASSVLMARKNLIRSGFDGEVIEASTEQSLQFIESDKPVVFDPPRAGLHSKVTEKCLEILPPQIIYLSCNPATHARDLKLLQQSYDIDFFEVYNFFPRTPHIETMAVLTRKG